MICIIHRIPIQLNEVKMNISEDFTMMPIFSRIAYSLRCLEKSLIFYNCSIDKWSWVLEKLWEFSSAQWFDEWCYEVTCYLPNIILEEKYTSENYEYISEEQYNRLYNLYSESNKIVLEILELVYEISEVEIYSRIANYSQDTLMVLKKIVEVMNANNIELPDFSDLSRISFDINRGWGERLGKEYSLILNNNN